MLAGRFCAGEAPEELAKDYDLQAVIPVLAVTRQGGQSFVFGAGFFTRDGRCSPEFISNYLDVYVKDALKRVPGAGDLGRRSVGTTAVGGMLLSTVLNLFFIPVLYVILSRLLKRDRDSAGDPVEA
jgi:HAE1 family hydrophobic/amphiphilic exporter-1